MNEVSSNICRSVQSQTHNHQINSTEKHTSTLMIVQVYPISRSSFLSLTYFSLRWFIRGIVIFVEIRKHALESGVLAIEQNLRLKWYRGLKMTNSIANRLENLNKLFRKSHILN